MKVFYSVSDAEQYVKTGDTSNMAWQGGTPKQTYSSELAFTSFDMSVHDSNSFDDYYIDSFIDVRSHGLVRTLNC